MDNNALNDGVFVMSEVKSIREAFAEASSFLSQSGCNEPQRSAQLLLEHVLGLSGAAYYMALADSFPAAVKEKWEAGVTRRVRVSRCNISSASKSSTGVLLK